MIEEVRSKLKGAGVRFLRILWCDNANVIRAKAPHVDSPGLATGVAISAAQQAVPVMYDAVVPGAGLGPVGEAQLVPVWDSLTILPYCPHHAQVVGEMVLAGEPWEHCPRHFLNTQLARLEAQGLSLKGAFENEFFLLRPSEDESGYRPADDTIYAMTKSMNVHAAVINELADSLIAQGMAIDYYYPESGPGQQELSIRYTDALRAADRQLIFRETVRGVAHKHGLVASFLPKIVEHAAGSGCHINLSLWRDGRNVTGAPGERGLSPEAQAFIAGVLEHLPALAALTIASTNSYRRIRPHVWAGAFRSWGYGNREASIRVTPGADKQAERFELKTADATANPYLALGAVVAAGLDGISRNLSLADEVRTDPGLLDESERQRRGIVLLPSTLGEALTALEHDELLLGALGSERAKTYLAVKRAEWEAMKDYQLEQEVKLLAERY